MIGQAGDVYWALYGYTNKPGCGVAAARFELMKERMLGYAPWPSRHWMMAWTIAPLP